MSQGEIKFLDAERYLRENGGLKTLHHQNERIVMQGITGVNEQIRLKMTIARKGTFCANSVNYLILHSGLAMSPQFVLGILNSKLMNFIFSKFSTNSNVNGYEVDNMPFPKKAPPTVESRIVNLAEEIIRSKHANSIALTRAKEHEIDQLVYQLYGLTDEEISIVEGGDA